MSVKTRVVPVNGGTKAYERVQIENLKVAQRHMADSILARSKMLAPKRTGDLRGDGRVETDSTTVAVVFGDDRIPYARIHELGGMTGRNHATKINAKHYLEQAGSTASKEGLQKWLNK